MGTIKVGKMDGIDQISLVLGELRADASEAKRVRDAMFRKLDEIHACMHETKGAVAVNSSRLNDVRHEVDVEIKPKIEVLERARNRAIGWAAAVGIGSGSLSGVLSKILGS